jgi:integrase
LGTDDSKNRWQSPNLHLPDVLTNLLAEHRRSVRFNSPDDFVLGRVDGTPQDPGYLRNKVLYEALKAAGINLAIGRTVSVCSGTRQGSIVHSITCDVKTTQELLGHSRLSTTAHIYTHVDKAGGEQASEALAKAIVPADISLASEKVQ